MNICLVGHGMMGEIHTAALRGADCVLQTLVGRRAEPTAAFAAAQGYKRWTLSLDDALADPEIDIVILANPSELHADTALASLGRGKHTLVEIPLAMTLEDAERVVAAAELAERTLGVVHPARMQPEMRALHERVENGDEFVRHVGGRFFIHRLQNVGASGYQRSWTDNLLWHHTAHLVDFGLWMLGESVRDVSGFMSQPDPLTGIPMEVVLSAETEGGQSLVCSGSYYGRERIFELLVITDQNSYRLDCFNGSLTFGTGEQIAAPWEENCARVTQDFLAAVRQKSTPAISGSSVLAAKQVLQVIQTKWDHRYGIRGLPGRPLHEV